MPHLRHPPLRRVLRQAQRFFFFLRSLPPYQMNAALELVENHRLDGIVYFADEEDVYSLHLFDRLRQIRY